MILMKIAKYPPQVFPPYFLQKTASFFPDFLVGNDLFQGILQMGLEQGIQVLTLLFTMCVSSGTLYNLFVLRLSAFQYENRTPSGTSAAVIRTT